MQKVSDVLMKKKMVSVELWNGHVLSCLGSYVTYVSHNTWISNVENVLYARQRERWFTHMELGNGT